MTHYQKLASIAFKIFGVALLILGLCIVIVSIIFLLFTFGIMGVRNINRIDFYWLYPILTGLFLIYKSNKLSIWVCRNFENND